MLFEARKILRTRLKPGGADKHALVGAGLLDCRGEGGDLCPLDQPPLISTLDDHQVIVRSEAKPDAHVDLFLHRGAVQT
jgi:hypothetical protein